LIISALMSLIIIMNILCKVSHMTSCWQTWVTVPYRHKDSFLLFFLVSSGELAWNVDLAAVIEGLFHMKMIQDYTRSIQVPAKIEEMILQPSTLMRHKGTGRHYEPQKWQVSTSKNNIGVHRIRWGFCQISNILTMNNAQCRSFKRMWQGRIIAERRITPAHA